MIKKGRLCCTTTVGSSNTPHSSPSPQKRLRGSYFSASPFGWASVLSMRCSRRMRLACTLRKISCLRRRRAPAGHPQPTPMGKMAAPSAHFCNRAQSSPIKQLTGESRDSCVCDDDRCAEHAPITFSSPTPREACVWTRTPKFGEGNETLYIRSVSIGTTKNGPIISRLSASGDASAVSYRTSSAVIAFQARYADTAVV